MTTPTQELINFTLRTKFGDLPGPVVHRARQVLFDSIGDALGSYSLDKAKIVLEFVKDSGGKPEATIIGNGRTSCPLAAFANGELINALEYDTNGPLGPHVTPFALPPVLAIGEAVHASGKDLITAIALAYEIGGRVAGSLEQYILKDEPPYIEASPRRGLAASVLGGVAGAGKLLRLDEAQLANSFGIAGASVPAPAFHKWTQTAPPSPMVKYNTWAGWIAQLATFAALLAKKEFTGDATILEGEWGFWKIQGSPFLKADVLTGELGEVWHLDQITFKPYPCCGINFTGIDGIAKLVRENNIQPEDIDSILVMGPPLLLTPVRTDTELRGPMDAQFTNAYLFAVAAYHGRHPGPIWQAATTINDSGIRELMKRVRVIKHPGSEELSARAAREGRLPASLGSFDAIVEITARGRKFTTEVTTPKGSPGNPLTDDELIEKFRNNVAGSPLNRQQVEKLIEMCYELEKIQDIAELCKLFAVEWEGQ